MNDYHRSKRRFDDQLGVLIDQVDELEKFSINNDDFLWKEIDKIKGAIEDIARKRLGEHERETK